jgi:hypothetical protein
MFRLLIYALGDVKRAANGGPRPPSQEIAHFCSGSNYPGIGEAKWLDDGTAIAFLGESNNLVAQVFTVNALGGGLRQISHSPTRILSFDLVQGGDGFIYTAEAPIDWSERRKHGYHVDLDRLPDLAGQGYFSLYPRAALSIDKKSVSRPLPVAEPPYDVINKPLNLWLSPHARWAVAVREVPDPPAS